MKAFAPRHTYLPQPTQEWVDNINGQMEAEYNDAKGYRNQKDWNFVSVPSTDIVIDDPVLLQQYMRDPGVEEGIKRFYKAAGWKEVEIETWKARNGIDLDRIYLTFYYPTVKEHDERPQ